MATVFNNPSPNTNVSWDNDGNIRANAFILSTVTYTVPFVLTTPPHGNIILQGTSSSYFELPVMNVAYVGVVVNFFNSSIYAQEVTSPSGNITSIPAGDAVALTLIGAPDNWSVGVAGLPGPQGPQGPQGIQGIPGATGAQGNTGAAGPAGPIGDTGAGIALGTHVFQIVPFTSGNGTNNAHAQIPTSTTLTMFLTDSSPQMNIYDFSTLTNSNWTEPNGGIAAPKNSVQNWTSLNAYDDDTFYQTDGVLSNSALKIMLPYTQGTPPPIPFGQQFNILIEGYQGENITGDSWYVPLFMGNNSLGYTGPQALNPDGSGAALGYVSQPGASTNFRSMAQCFCVGSSGTPSDWKISYSVL